MIIIIYNGLVVSICQYEALVFLVRSKVRSYIRGSFQKRLSSVFSTIIVMNPPNTAKIHGDVLVIKQVRLRGLPSCILWCKSLLLIKQVRLTHQSNHIFFIAFSLGKKNRILLGKGDKHAFKWVHTSIIILILLQIILLVVFNCSYFSWSRNFF